MLMLFNYPLFHHNKNKKKTETEKIEFLCLKIENKLFLVFLSLLFTNSAEKKSFHSYENTFFFNYITNGNSKQHPLCLITKMLFLFLK